MGGLGETPEFFLSWTRIWHRVNTSGVTQEGVTREVTHSNNRNLIHGDGVTNRSSKTRHCYISHVGCGSLSMLVKNLLQLTPPMPVHWHAEAILTTVYCNSHNLRESKFGKNSTHGKMDRRQADKVWKKFRKRSCKVKIRRKISRSWEKVKVRSILIRLRMEWLNWHNTGATSSGRKCSMNIY